MSMLRRLAHAVNMRRLLNGIQQTILGDFAYKFPPTPRVGLVWPRPHRPALILLFAKKFFRAPHTRARMRQTGQIFWLLASGPAAAGRTFFPPSPFFCGGSRIGCTTKEPQATRLPLQRLAHGKSYPSYSSATAPDSHGISCADPLFQARKEPHPEVAACARRFKIYLIDCVLGWFFSQSARHRRSWFHRLQSHARAPEKISTCASHGD